MNLGELFALELVVCCSILILAIVALGVSEYLLNKRYELRLNNESEIKSDTVQGEGE